MIKYLENKIKIFNFQLNVKAEIVSIMKKSDFDIKKMNVIERAKINELKALLDTSKQLA